MCTLTHKLHQRIEKSRGSKSLPRDFYCKAEHIGEPKEFVPVYFGGAEGNRTPVRKQLGKNFSGRSLLFTFPHGAGNKHPEPFGSVMMHGMRNA